MIIYKTKVCNIGNMVGEFGDDKLIILFGDNAPDLLKEFCYTIDISDINGKIEVGDTVHIKDNIFRITAIGSIAQKNLRDLGHITLVFDASKDAKLEGSIYLSKGEIPKINIDDEIKIYK